MKSKSIGAFKPLVFDADDLRQLIGKMPQGIETLSSAECLKLLARATI
jgi:hypothetical protein